MAGASMTAPPSPGNEAGWGVGTEFGTVDGEADAVGQADGAIIVDADGHAQIMRGMDADNRHLEQRLICRATISTSTSPSGSARKRNRPLSP